MRSISAWVIRVALLTAVLAAGCGRLPDWRATPEATATSTSRSTSTSTFTSTLSSTSTSTPAPTVAPKTMVERLDELGAFPCPRSEFTCVTLSVPADHFGAGSAMLDAVFAVLPASGERRGTLVVAVGGPGASGVAWADSYAASYAESILERFDLVFFDQRGIGLSGGIQCPQAAAAYYQTDGRADTPEQEANVVAAAQAFATACVAHIRDTAVLPYLGTRQAVEDLEAFREAMGIDRIWLYGESYGTQYAQTYAAAHPDRLAGMILDGTVDLTLTGTEFARGSALAFERVLSDTLAACAADEACVADAGRDPAAAYAALAGRLAKGPLGFDFPLAAGKAEPRVFTRADLDTAVAGYASAPDARMILLRALAAAARDDLAPLARLLYSSLGVDPETQEAVLDPTYSDAAYYAVTCNDYQYFTGSPEERAAAYLRAGDGVELEAPRLGSLFYGDLPCAFWPAGAADDARPAPLKADDIPTLVLGATADPLTPLSNGLGVYSRLADGYHITTEGGAHVMFGRGYACPDDLVTAFLADGQPPAERETTCENALVEAYAPVAPVNARAFRDPLEALESFVTEARYLPEFYYWDGAAPATVACARGGNLSFEPKGDEARLVLRACAFSAGFALTGSGEYDAALDRFALQVEVSGRAKGSLEFTREGDGWARVTGTYGGRKVNLERETP